MILEQIPAMFVSPSLLVRIARERRGRRRTATDAMATNGLKESPILKKYVTW